MTNPKWASFSFLKIISDLNYFHLPFSTLVTYNFHSPDQYSPAPAKDQTAVRQGPGCVLASCRFQGPVVRSEPPENPEESRVSYQGDVTEKLSEV